MTLVHGEEMSAEAVATDDQHDVSVFQVPGLEEAVLREVGSLQSHFRVHLERQVRCHQCHPMHMHQLSRSSTLTAGLVLMVQEREFRDELKEMQAKVS